MNNIPDKLVITTILITVLFVFGLIFSVKSPERKIIDSPIISRGNIVRQLKMVFLKMKQ